jgi:beta-glucuronidase
MERMFQQHAVRKTFSLDGAWEYYFPQQGVRIEPAEWVSGERRVMEVPGVWEMLAERKNYRGQAVARKMVHVPEEGWLRLVFKGVSHTARVFVDGREIGGHHNAYTPFTLDAGRVAAGEHEILVHISNEHAEISALHVPNDYYNYGGISRPVTMHLIPGGLLIRHVQTEPSPEKNGWKVACRAEILNAMDQARTVTLRSALAGATANLEVNAVPGTTVVEWELAIAGVRPWSPEDPALYLLETALAENGQAVDDLVERIGFRTLAVRGEEILLNGEKVFPMGFNRHEDHPDYGCAIPVAIMRLDLERMRAMGANAVRTSHYPYDERFLDLCDEQGILVWEENHARGLDLGKMRHPRFREQCAACNEEMVREHVNHPCIFVWGILNECESGIEEGATMYREQFDQIRALDHSRPVTFASCRHETDLCQGMIDIAGWNIYPRWYSEEPVRDCLEELIARREPEGMRGKPLIISEIGAGGIPGCHDPVRRPKWSEERQADILDEQLGCVLNHPRVAGVFVWQYCDVRVDEGISVTWGRPRSMNNKGAVDEHRRPKLVFDVIKHHFAAKAGLPSA